jgi:Ca2+-binding RTX toxin-like protein
VAGWGASNSTAGLNGGAGADSLVGSIGGDVLSGGDGADTIDGFTGADTLAGGAGADLYIFGQPNQSTTASSGMDNVLDFESIDTLRFAKAGLVHPAGDPGTAANYAEFTAISVSDALNQANAQIAGGTVNYVAVQVGINVFLFADSSDDNGSADSAVQLTGKQLSDIAFTNIV